MSALQCNLYRAVIRLHPAAFRTQFGREMALDFNDALAHRGFVPLLADALLSLARQWSACLLPPPELQSPSPSRPLLAGQYLAVDQGSPLTPFDLILASILSVLLLLTIGFAASIPNSRAIATLPAIYASRDIGIDTGGFGSPNSAAGHQTHRAAEGVKAVPPASGSSDAPFHGILHLSMRRALPSWGFRASGGPSPSVTLAHALRQLAFISIVVWLTSLFLRRSAGIAGRAAVIALGLLGLAADVEQTCLLLSVLKIFFSCGECGFFFRELLFEEQATLGGF